MTFLLAASLVIIILLIFWSLSPTDAGAPTPQLTDQPHLTLLPAAIPAQLDAQRELAPLWANPQRKEEPDRHSQSILFSFIDALPSPALPFLEHAPLLYDGLISGRAAQLCAWRVNAASPSLVFELIAPLPWAATTDLAIHMRPHPLDEQAVRTGLLDVDSQLALHGVDADLIRLLCLHDAQLVPGLSSAPASASLVQGQLTLRWLIHEPGEAAMLARDLPSVLGRWHDLRQQLPTPKTLLRALLAEPTRPNKALLCALAPGGAMHGHLDEILQNPALASAPLRPLAWILLSSFPAAAPDALFTQEMLQYGIPLLGDDARRDELLQRARLLLSPEQWRRLIEELLATDDPELRLWAAAHTTTSHDHPLYLNGIAHLCALLAHPQLSDRARALLTPQLRPDQHARWVEPFTIFFMRQDRSKDPEGASPAWLSFMAEREHIQLALITATTAEALHRSDAAGSLNELFRNIDKIQDQRLHHALLQHLYAITAEDHALALRIFEVATQRSTTELEQLATRLAAEHPEDARYIGGLERLAATGRDEAQRAQAIRTLIQRLPPEQRATRLSALSAQGVPSVRLAAISFMHGREALTAFAGCLTQGVCPPQIIAESLDWIDDLLTDEPALWPLLLDAFHPIPRFERLLSITLIMERGVTPPAWLLSKLFTPEELDAALTRGELLTIYNRIWGALSPWLLALPYSPDAEQLWRAALIPAPAPITPELINLLGAHASGQAIGALAPLRDHPSFGPAARAATRAIAQRIGAHMAGSLEWVDQDDQRGQLSLSTPAKGQLELASRDGAEG